MKKEIITSSPEQTAKAGILLGQRLEKGDIVAFKGGLGVGKTTFTRGVAKGMGCDENEVSSPTFALINEYRGGRFPICHMDAYRLDDAQQLFDTGFFEYADMGWVCLIEWSENVRDAITPRIEVDISIIDENTRKIVIEENEPCC